MSVAKGFDSDKTLCVQEIVSGELHEHYINFEGWNIEYIFNSFF